MCLCSEHAEFLVADLALASHSIQSITLAEARLLAPVLEAHQPDAIITHAFLLPQLLELIYEAADARNVEHTIVVVGEPTAAAMASVASNVKVLRFADLEREGTKVEKRLSTLPSESILRGICKPDFLNVLCRAE